MSVGGTPALAQDSIHSLFDKLPLMVVLLITTTTILMFLAFGSVVLPIKAALMSALTLGSTMGVLTWMFVDGHGSGLMNYTPQPLMAPMIGLIIAVIWGLSTDYEVFLVSRMVEARERGMSTAEAIRIGTATTGRLITGAALVLAVVAGAFVFSDLVMMKYLAFGLLIALLLDATVVRMFLVPAIMKTARRRLLVGAALDEAAAGTPRPRRDRAARRAQAPRGARARREPRRAGRCRRTAAAAAAAAARPDPSGRRGRVAARCADDADPDCAAAPTARPVRARPGCRRREPHRPANRRPPGCRRRERHAQAAQRGEQLATPAASAQARRRRRRPRREEREIESWLGELRGNARRSRPSAARTETASADHRAPSATTAIPTPRPGGSRHSNGMPSRRPAIPAQKPASDPAATEKLDRTAKAERQKARTPPRRGGGSERAGSAAPRRPRAA